MEKIEDMIEDMFLTSINFTIIKMGTSRQSPHSTLTKLIMSFSTPMARRMTIRGNLVMVETDPIMASSSTVSILKSVTRSGVVLDIPSCMSCLP